MTVNIHKKLIEVALPLQAINEASAREKSIRHGHPSTLHLWWARRPLAAARAVIFAQMVDDPSASPDLFPTEQKQEKERKRLFKIIEELVKWENTTNEAVLQQARDEIWQSWRRACAENADHPRAKELFDRHVLPAFHDPFAGGGALPLEAQRLGLEAYASDLNPVAVLINKAMIEIPPKFAGMPPVNPVARSEGRGVRSEIEEKEINDALSGNGFVGEGNVHSQGSISVGAEASEGRNLRDAVPDNAGGCVHSGEHSGRVDAGDGQGQSTLPGDCAGVTGRNGNAADAMRGPELVSEKRYNKSAPTVGRGKPDTDHHASKTSPDITPLPSHSSLLFPHSYSGAQGLAEDVRYYGQWMRDEAEKRIGHLYPRVKAWRDPKTGRYYGEADVEAWMRNEKRGESIEELCASGYSSLSSFLASLSSTELTVIAWLWARTVKSPNPAFAHVDVPLASTFMLSTKAGKEAWVEVEIEEERSEGRGARREKENGAANLPLTSHSSSLSPSSSPLTSHSSSLSPSSPYRFTVRTGKPRDAASAKAGTKLARGANFKCIMSGTPIPSDHIYTEANAGRMGAKLMAIVAEGERGRVYLSPSEEHEAIARTAQPEWMPENLMPDNPRWFSPPLYGLKSYGDLFTPRQLVALTTFSDLVQEAREKVLADALGAPASLPAWDSKQAMGVDAAGRDAGAPSTAAQAYADAVAVYLAFAVDKGANYWSSLCAWHQSRDGIVSTFGRQALPMVWDYSEANPLSDSSGNIMLGVEQAVKMVSSLGTGMSGLVCQSDAQTQPISKDKVISTDPPYYDNIGYADLSDFFYVWLRRSLKPILPDLFATLEVPKAQELVATPYRHGSKKEAEAFFLVGMSKAVWNLCEQAHPAFPVTIYYAFKQTETRSEKRGVRREERVESSEKREVREDTDASNLTPHSSSLTPTSTGWETFLDAVISAGFAITGTWPMRTEYTGNLKRNVSALASSIVLVCRKRPADAPVATRREFITALKAELPEALVHLQRGNIAPVDLAQAAIGPGMGVFTRYGRVVDAEGRQMPVREALALINQVLDEALAAQEGDFDADTRWALAWFEQHGFGEGEYGVAETLSTAKNTSVAGLAASGIIESKRGRVCLLRPNELSAGWDPVTDPRLNTWELVHRLVHALETGGESAAAAIVAALGANAESARELAYRLYTLCERKKRANEALSYNGLVQSWPEIVRLAKHKPGTVEEEDLFV